MKKRDIQNVSIADTSYIRYRTDLQNKSYGGNQGWFRELPNVFGGKWLSTVGCGLTASCDMIFYLQNSHRLAKLTDLTPDNIGKNDYSNFAYRYINNYIFKGFRNWKGIGGIFPKALCGGLNRYFYDKGYANYKFKFKYFFSYYFSGDSGKQRFKKDMYDMLKNDLPVIVRIGTGNVQRLPASAKKNTFHWHYVTVTEMNADITNGRIALTCSSWGNKYTMDLDDLFGNAGLTGGMVIAEDK